MRPRFTTEANLIGLVRLETLDGVCSYLDIYFSNLSVFSKIFQNLLKPETQNYKYYLFLYYLYRLDCYEEDLQQEMSVLQEAQQSCAGEENLPEVPQERASRKEVIFLTLAY